MSTDGFPLRPAAARPGAPDGGSRLSRPLGLLSMLGRLGLLALLALGSGPLPALAQDGTPAESQPTLKIAEVRVEPANPAADTLCRLTVALENTDERIASQLGFTITINGQELPVYRNHLFMFRADPGGTSELPLYNFWSTETSRPMPESGKLEIEVSLREARWMTIETIDGTETWTPIGDVEGLPVARSVTLEMTK